jgi:hypothetical protein
MTPTVPATTTAKPCIKRGSKPFIYHVESKSKPGRFHVTDVHRLTCTCPAGRHQRGCWHLKVCLAYDGWRRAQYASAAAARHETVA